jgi:membrane-associated phospholipid phosphatase
MNLLAALSDAGDSAVLLPLALLLIAALWRYQSRAAATTLIVAMAACGAVIIVLKITLIACGQVWNAGVVSPSGHASMSTTVYGALGIIAARQAPRWQQPAIVLGSWLFVGAIAISRVVLGAHSYAEVGLGLLIGAAALCLFAVPYFRLRKAPLNLALLVALSVAIVLVLHGAHLPVEGLLHRFALFGRSVTGICPGIGNAGSPAADAPSEKTLRVALTGANG